MPTLLLDTSVIIDALNGKRDRRNFLRDLLEHGNILACCPINVAEVYAGMRPNEEGRTTAFLSSLDFYPITFPAARLAGELKNNFGRMGTSLSMTDSLIAAVAMYHRLALITDNVKDFPMRDIQLYPLPERRRSI
jgi:predicted nucleic acid-binding protein